jgi:ABC-type lipoprotein release transport system permease subunit
LLPKLFSGVLNGFALQGPSVAVGAGLVVSLVAWFATYLPARRAMNLDPMWALRAE